MAIDEIKWEDGASRCEQSCRKWCMRLILVCLLLMLASLALPCQAQEIPRSAVAYRADLVRIAHAEWGLDAPVATFAAQIHQESGWNPAAVSRVGAKGMAQFMPATAKWWCDLHGQTAQACQPANPVWAMRALVGYDRWLYQRIAAETDCERMAMALSAYNGGLGWLLKDKALAQASGSTRMRWWNAVERYNGGRSQAAFVENRGYPQRIIKVIQPAYAAWGMGVCA